jgi:type 1 glutamine amidotransferase
MTRPGSNSGIYFHTEYQETGWPDKGYEVQVNNTHSDWRKTGGLYAVQDVRVSSARDNEWFTEHITVKNKHIVIKVNGKTTVDWTELEDWNPPFGMPGRRLSFGTFALQGHDPGSVVYFKNIMVKPLPDDIKIKAVVVTGGHDYEKESFNEMFDSFDGIECTNFQLKDDSEIFEDITGWDYDVIVLHNMTQQISPKRQKNFIELLNRGVGLVALHHSICSFHDWPGYKKIIGGRYYLEGGEENGIEYKAGTYRHDVDVNVKIADATHPITQGVSDFVIHDEVYKNCRFESDNHVLLTTDHPDSDTTIGWVRRYGTTRVCYIQPGHDRQAYENPNYRRLVSNAIKWCAGSDTIQAAESEPAARSQTISIASRITSTAALDNRQVEKKTPRGLGFYPEMSFAEALDRIRHSVEPPLNIAVLWRDLYENTDIDRMTPINMEDVSGVTVKAALKLLLASVSGSGSQLGYVVQDGVIIIATVDSLPKNYHTRIYDISDLIFW